MENGISVGYEKESIEVLRGIILSILGSGQEQETLRKALDVLSSLASINDVYISNCTIGDHKEEV